MAVIITLLVNSIGIGIGGSGVVVLVVMGGVHIVRGVMVIMAVGGCHHVGHRHHHI